MIHDCLDVGRLLGAGPVDFDPDLDTVAFRRLSTFDQRLANLLQRLFNRHSLGQPVRPDFHPGPTDAVDQLDEVLASLNVLLDDLLIGRVEFANTAASPEHDSAIGESLLHFCALVGIECRLDSVLVSCPALDSGYPYCLADLQDGWQIPLRGNVVRDHPQFEVEWFGFGFRGIGPCRGGYTQGS